MPPVHLARVLALALIALLAVAGCGDDEPSDSEQIESVLVRNATTKSIKDQCETTVSARFVRDVYGSLSNCRKVSKPDPDDFQVEDATVAATRVDGAKATAAWTVAVPSARIAGRVALVKVTGVWKLDRLGTDFARSLIAGSIAQTKTAEDRQAARCLVRAARRSSGGQARRLVYAFAGSRYDDLPRDFLVCFVTGADARRAFREGLVKDFRDDPEISATAAQARCMARRMIADLSDGDIAALALSPGTPAAIERKLERSAEAMVRIC